MTRPLSSARQRPARRLAAVALGALALTAPVLGGVLGTTAAAAAGTVWYAAPAAHGAGTCVDAADACTFATALSDVASGDTIDLEPGTYENVFDEQPQVADLTITNDPSNPGQALIEGPGDEEPIFTNTAGTDLTISGVASDGAAGIEIVGATTTAVLNGTAGTPATLSITGVVFNSNENDGGNGGAIDNINGALSVTASSFQDNLAAVGGAIDSQSGSLSVTTTSFSNNSASATGGAIANAYSATAASPLSVSDSSFTGNNAGAGGTTISNADGATGTGYALAISDSTFDDGSTTPAVYNGAPADPDNYTELYASTFTQSSATDLTSPFAQVYLAANIFSGGCNLAGPSSVTDDGYNEEAGTSCTNSGPDDVTNATITLGTFQNNGGPTDTAVPNAGDASLGLIPASTSVTLPGVGSVALCPTTDQRGVTSTAGTPCDAGAVQIPAAAPTTTVLETSTPSETYGAETPVTYTATVTTDNGAIFESDDTVVVTVDASHSCTVDLVANGTDSVSGDCELALGLTTLDAGDDGAIGVYSGETGIAPSTSGPAPLIIEQDTTTTSVSAAPTSTSFRAAGTTTFTATVTTGNGEEFTGPESTTIDVGGPTCTATLDPAAGGASGTCTIDNNEFPAGDYSASTTYPGDTDLTASSGSADFGVTPDSTDTLLTVSTPSVTVGDESAATFEVTISTGNGESPGQMPSIRNGSERPNGPAPVTVTVDVGGASCVATLTNAMGPADLHPDTPPRGPATGSCSIGNSDLPVGDYTASVTYKGNANLTASTGTTPFSVTPGCPSEGYRVVAANGVDDAFGGAPIASFALSPDIVAATNTPCGAGYWAASSNGSVDAIGAAGFYGSAAATHLNAPIVGMAATPDGKGYWLVAADGGVFSFGDASFSGSTGSLHLNAPIVGMAATPDGKGYWLVAADGGIFSFGDANFSGSTGSLHLNAPIVGMASTPDGNGYWLVASDGGVFTFGDASFSGSAGGTHLAAPVTGIAATPDGGGYWLAGADGGVLSYGDAPFDGSAAGHVSAPVIAISATGSQAG